MVTARGNRHKPTQVSSTRFVVFDFAAQVGWALKQNTATVNAMTWTIKAVNIHLENLTAGDAHVEAEWVHIGRFYQSGRPLKERRLVCLDKYRPGMQFIGRTPAEAARAAGFYIPHN